MYVYLLLYEPFYNIINSIGHNQISVPVLTNGLGRNLISFLGLTYSLGCRLISALVLTCHLECQIILLILLCLAAPFLTASGCFCLDINVTRMCTFVQYLVGMLIKILMCFGSYIDYK